MGKVRITLEPGGRQALVDSGLTLKECLASLGIMMRGSCGGKGSCGECRVIVDGRQVNSCTYRVSEGISVEVPMRSLVPVGSAGAGQSTAVKPVEPGAMQSSLAIDVGTTTIAASMDRPGLPTITRVCFNPQIARGDDVISRIMYAEDNPHGKDELREMALDAVNEHIDAFKAASHPDECPPRRVAVAGNTTMLWTLLGRDLSPVRHEIIDPADLSGVLSTAGSLGLRLPPNTPVMLMPQVSAFVGGDAVAGILATGLHSDSRVRLLVDLGTNGEIVLGGSDWMVACACSVGPAFEGGGISWGVPAVPGAIEHVEYDRREHRFKVATLGDDRPLGICGSGLISLLGSMLDEGLIDRRGAINPAHVMLEKWGTCGPGVSPSVPVIESDAGMISLSASDISNLIRAKAAVYAGISTLFRRVGLRTDDVDEILVAGGFGASLDIDRAISIGLLPDVSRARYRPVGNASLAGAVLCARDEAHWNEALDVARRVTYLDLNQDGVFMEEYVAAMFLPHTDLGRFGSIRCRKGKEV